MILAALAAAMTLVLGACAGGIDTKPDKPVKMANVCADSAIPKGWIRTNDWRGKGCGVEENATARDQRAGIQLASTARRRKPKRKRRRWTSAAAQTRSRRTAPTIG